MRNIRLITVDRAGRVEQHRTEILPDVADLGGVLFHAVKDKLDMRAVQLHKLAFHQLCRVVIPGNADFPAGAAYRFKHDVHDLVQHFLVHHVVLTKMLILNVVKDDFTVNLKCFILLVCRFLSLPIRRRSRLSLVLRQGKGVRGKDRNGIGT